MVEVRRYNVDGAGEPQMVELDEALFGAKVNGDLLYRTVRMQLLNRRQGNSSTKTRGEVSGGGAKPWRQKGTGRARAGSRRSPLWTGGGTVFGPKPKTYHIKLTKKMLRGALISAMSDRAAGGNIAIIDGITFDEPKTKRAATLLEKLAMNSSTLVVVGKGEYNQAVKKSFSNLPRVKCLASAGLNVYDILRHDGLVLTAEALNELKERL
ncbi:50S ribosomal protein L4 [Candidatus Bipolaricaulota bacterium]|nr:50S ribosomal protein L4 [Candidatus Bipolaricaulota bacterium]HHR84860.1 50S ribosomal protein L4 [Candidatus Acetothermia bacterium]